MSSLRHPLEAIVSDGSPTPASDNSISNEAVEPKPLAPSHITITDQSPVAETIDLKGIKDPALLINDRLEIAWQNEQAVDQIWHNAVAAKNCSMPNLLDLVFDPVFKRQVANFSKCQAFFLKQIRGILSDDILREQISQLGNERQAILLSLLGQLDAIDTQNNIYGGYLNQVRRSGQEVSFMVVGATFREGRLLIFEPQAAAPFSIEANSNHNVLDSFKHIRRQPNPLKTPYFVVAARLDNASNIRTEMLADDHWRLVNDLYRRCLIRIEQQGGIFGGHIENGFYAYFLPHQNLKADPMGVIECTLAIKSQAIELGKQWKVSKNWPGDIDLNICIHYEKEYVGTLPTSTGELLTSFGNGLQVASAVSQLAQQGQIWATKAMINQMPTEQCKKMRFGIMRPADHQQQKFIRNGFGAIKDIFSQASCLGEIEETLRILAVTQVFDLSGGEI